MKTEAAIQEFMISRGGLRPKTQREYLSHLTSFNESFPELPTQPQPVQSWLNSQGRQRGSEKLAPETVHSRFRTLRAFYHQIHLWHPKIHDPMPLVRAPLLKTKAMRTFTEEELYRMFTLSLSLRDRTMATLLLDTGIRAQECVLKWDDVRLEYIIVSGKTGERNVPITEQTSRLLQSLKAESNHNHYVFQGKRGPLTSQGIYKVIRHICHHAELSGRRCSPHTFRHTFGTEYAASGSCDPAALQAIMGHSDFKTTMRYIQNNLKRNIGNHRLCTPLRLISTAAQGALFSEDSIRAIKEAEAILAREKANRENDSRVPGS